MTTSARVRDLTVPDDLAERDQWVLWRRETVSGRETKVPYSVRGLRASSTNPADWSDFPRTLATWRRYPERYTGLGFVFSAEDPFVGIDLDDCLGAGGTLTSWAQGVVEQFSDTYIEISQGGKVSARAGLGTVQGGTAHESRMALSAASRVPVTCGVPVSVPVRAREWASGGL